MKDQEVDMITGWNGRFDNAKKDGAIVGYTFNQALRDYDGFGIPKGAPNKDTAMKFLAEGSSLSIRQICHFTSHMAQLTKRLMRLQQLQKSSWKHCRHTQKNVSKMLAVSLDWYAKNRKKLKKCIWNVERIIWHHKNQNTRAKARVCFLNEINHIGTANQ